jgi:two-component system, LytTR family, sensor kinase
LTVSPEITPDEASKARDRWILAGVIIGFALFCAAVEASQNYVAAINFGRPVQWRESIRRTTPSWIVLAALVPGVLYMARRFPIDRWRKAIFVHLAAASVFALAHLGGTAVFYAFVDGTFKNTLLLLNKFVSAYFILDVLVYCGIVGASHAARFYREARARELAGSRLQESLTHARLAALRGQLNPHFLFNTLNAITTMALKREHDNVVVTLGYLSELLRVSLDDSLPQEVSLADELELLDRYLEIQRIRFGDRLTVTQDVEPDALGALVPIMILQPLAENAIVHGIAPVTGPGQVRLRGSRQNGELVLEVSDTGPGFDATRPRARSSTGIGLSNTRARLTQLYGDASSLTMGTGVLGGACVSVRIPFRPAPPAAVRTLAASSPE